MKILVSGGAGFIGSHLVDAYISRGFQVVIVDDLSSGSENNLADALKKGAVLYKTKIQSPEILEIFKREKPDLVNHHAAQKSVRDSVNDPVKDADINLIGLLNVLESARKVNCKKVIFASSGGVIYGEQNEFPANEDHIKRPCSPYGVSKLASELYLDFYFQQWNFGAVALRYANVFGPRQDPFGEAGVVAIFSSRMMKKQDTMIFGSGLQTRDFVYISDIVSANMYATDFIMKRSSGFFGFNIGTASEVSILDIHRGLAEHAKYSMPPVMQPAKSGEQLRSCLSYDLAKKDLGWSPKENLHNALKMTYEYFSKAN